MNQSRINHLVRMRKENPEDPFLHYAYGLEFKEMAIMRAIEIWKETIVQFPNYSPTYYALANALYEADLYEEALVIAKKGAVLLQAEGNEKAIHEMDTLLQNIDMMDNG